MSLYQALPRRVHTDDSCRVSNLEPISFMPHNFFTHQGPVMKLRSRTLAPPTTEPRFLKKFVWRGTVIPVNQTPEVIDFFAHDLGVRVRYLCTIVTPAGRTDAVFSLHPQDVTKFAVTRFKLGSDAPSWWEDYLAGNAVSERDLVLFQN